MQVPCHARAFCQSLIEANADGSRDLMQSQQMKSPQNENCGHNAENSEPVCLIPGRRDYEVQCGTGVVPDAIVVACDHAKPVSSWAKVTIESLPPLSWLLPDCVAPFQFVAKAYFLRDHKTQCRVLNFEITRKRRKTKFFAR